MNTRYFFNLLSYIANESKEKNGNIVNTEKALPRRFDGASAAYQTLKKKEECGNEYHMVLINNGGACSACSGLEGSVYISKSPKSKVIPAGVHPNCKCVLVSLDIAKVMYDNKDVPTNNKVVIDKLQIKQESSSQYLPLQSWHNALKPSDSPIVNQAREDALKVAYDALGSWQRKTNNDRTFDIKLNFAELRDEFVNSALIILKLIPIKGIFQGNLKSGIIVDSVVLQEYLSSLDPTQPGYEDFLKNFISMLSDKDKRALAKAEAQSFIENSEYKYLAARNATDSHIKKITDNLYKEIEKADIALKFLTDFPNKEDVSIYLIAEGIKPESYIIGFFGAHFDDVNKMGDVDKTKEYYNAYKEQLLRIIFINTNREQENENLARDLDTIYSKYGIIR